MNFDKVTITQQLRYKQIMNTQARMKVVCAENIEKRIQEQNKQKKNTILRHVLYKMASYSHREYARSAACSLRL
jgi:hypothetical protein